MQEIDYAWIRSIVRCQECRTLRAPRKAPACAEHLTSLLSATRVFIGTPEQLDVLIDKLISES